MRQRNAETQLLTEQQLQEARDSLEAKLETAHQERGSLAEQLAGLRADLAAIRDSKAALSLELENQRSAESEEMKVVQTDAAKLRVQVRAGAQEHCAPCHVRCAYAAKNGVTDAPDFI